MKTLELKPLEKDLQVILVEKEYEEPWDIDYLSSQEESIFRKPSSEFCEALMDLIKEYDPDFITDELGMRSEGEFQRGRIAELLEEEDILFKPVEMDDYAKPYLANKLDEIKERQTELRNEYNKLYTDNPDEKTEKKLDKILSYGQYLQQKYEEELDKITYPVRQKWLAMGIFETAKEIDKEDITAIHLCSPSYVTGMKTLLNSLDVEVEKVEMEKEVKEPTDEFGSAGISDYAENVEVKVVPNVVTAAEGKEEKKDKDILFYFDTDESASPFDILMAYDAGYDEVVPYQSVTAEKTKDLVQDAIFPRGPEGVKHTSFFIGGADVQEVKKILEDTKEAMFPPFEASVMVDPRGSNTTASAMVAKVEKGLAEIGEIGLDDKKVTILAGTGPVGRVAAMLCANEGADVTITSRHEDKAKNISEELSEECGHEIKGVRASSDEEVYGAIKDADVILSAGPEGIRIISEDVLEKLEGKTRIVADVNAVPPTGVANLDPNDDVKEIKDGIYGIGALAIGNLKRKAERALLIRTKDSDKGIFDHQEAFEAVKEELEMPEAAPKVS